MRYPTSCTSMYCGETRTSDYCKNCRHRPALDTYIAWQQKNQQKIAARITPLKLA